MFCPKCGSEIGKGDRFCSNCGTMIEEGISASPSIGVAGKQNLPLIGGAFLLLSFFMPWIDLGFISVSGFNLLKAASGAEKLLALIAWFVPIGGGITAYLAYTKNRNTTITSLIAGAVALLVWVWLFFSIGTDIKKMSGSFGDVFKAMGVGLYIMLAGIVCLGIGIKRR